MKSLSYACTVVPSFLCVPFKLCISLNSKNLFSTICKRQLVAKKPLN